MIDNVLNCDIEESFCHVLNKHAIEKGEGKVSEKVSMKWILVSRLEYWWRADISIVARRNDETSLSIHDQRRMQKIAQLFTKSKIN